MSTRVVESWGRLNEIVDMDTNGFGEMEMSTGEDIHEEYSSSTPVTPFPN